MVVTTTTLFYSKGRTARTSAARRKWTRKALKNVKHPVRWVSGMEFRYRQEQVQNLLRKLTEEEMHKFLSLTKRYKRKFLKRKFAKQVFAAFGGWG
jgi:hypothetical protein